MCLDAFVRVNMYTKLTAQTTTIGQQATTTGQQTTTIGQQATTTGQQTTTIGQQATTTGQQTTTIDQQTTEQVNSFNEQSIMELKIISTMLHYVMSKVVMVSMLIEIQLHEMVISL